MSILKSSLRSVDPHETLRRARAVAPQLGISRVTDTTRLDRIGIPVYAAVRPGALAGSLCVNAGKGTTSVEAEVGAYMEAIEFAVAEPQRGGLEVHLRTARDVLDGHIRPDAILDFCPIARQGFDLSEPLACVEAADLLGQGSTLVPAEQVLLPYVHRPGTGKFGSHSNGLASGNSVTEATLHALLEVIERDIRSFQYVMDRSRLVAADSLPPIAQDLCSRLSAARIDWIVRTHPNPFGLGFFQFLMCDPEAGGPFHLTAGYGCHVVREIALVRAITEAVQSRLSWIHGGRDDLAEDFNAANADAPYDAGMRAAAHLAQLRVGAEEVAYGDTPGSEDRPDIARALDGTMAVLQREGIRHVCRVIYRPPDASLSVVRVIVPRLEYLNRGTQRVGPRLHALLKHRHG